MELLNIRKFQELSKAAFENSSDTLDGITIQKATTLKGNLSYEDGRHG